MIILFSHIPSKTGYDFQSITINSIKPAIKLPVIPVKIKISFYYTAAISIF